MAATRIFLNADMSNWQAKQIITLPKEAAHHVSTVLRKKTNALIHLFNGHGQEWVGLIASTSKRATTIQLQNTVVPLNESPVHTHLGIALIRAERFDFALQKSVELGVNCITPLLTDNVSLKQTKTILAKKQTHWQRIIESACEQSGRSWMPKLLPTTAINKWFANNQNAINFILHPKKESEAGNLLFGEKNGQADHPTRALDIIKKRCSSLAEKSITITIGPEGGFTHQEIESAEAKGFTQLSFGERILRAETAPLVILSLIQAQLGDF